MNKVQEKKRVFLINEFKRKGICYIRFSANNNLPLYQICGHVRDNVITKT